MLDVQIIQCYQSKALQDGITMSSYSAFLLADLFV